MMIGIDLAGSERNITGICVMDHDIRTFSVRRDEEIIELVESAKGKIIAIDAPLSFHGKAFRDCDVEIREHCRIMPLTLHGMRRLTERGMRLAKLFRRKYEVIEVYPYASKKFLDIKSEHDLKKFGVHAEIKNKDEFDAIICALTAKFYLKGKYRTFGEKDKIIVPAL